MSSYHSHSPRHSSGSLRHYSPLRDEYSSPSRSSYDDHDYQDSSLPLNTPWSSPAPPANAHPRRGRTSVSNDDRPVILQSHAPREHHSPRHHSPRRHSPRHH